MSPTSKRGNVWRIPLVLATLTLSGLMSALLGEHEVWKTMSWLALGVPIAIGLWLARPRRDQA